MTWINAPAGDQTRGRHTTLLRDIYHRTFKTFVAFFAFCQSNGGRLERITGDLQGLEDKLVEKRIRKDKTARMKKKFSHCVLSSPQLLPVCC
ncbi:hypothetical protein P5V15_008237 [Pogonomyrmex californicus]